MSNINKLPVGLLDLLGLKTQGRNPAVFGQQLVPTLDASPFYRAFSSVLLVDNQPLASAASGSVLAATVPVGQYWWILGGAALCASLAGATGSAYIELGSDQNTGWVSDTLSVAAANANAAMPLRFGIEPILLPPGSRIIKFGYGMAGAGNERLNLRLTYVPLQA